MGRTVHGTNGLHVVRIVRGTNSQWYETSRHCCAGYGVLLAAEEECSNTLITHPLHTPLHIRDQLILFMLRGCM